MKKILFVIPPFSEHGQRKGKSDIKSDKKELRVYPYLGVCYLISALEQDYDVQLIDAPADNLSFDELIKKVESKNPGIIALTVSTFTLNVSYRIIKACKAVLPSAKIIIGGPHINHSPQDFKYFNADYGLKGDTEFTIKQLMDAIVENTSVKEIPGIIYKEEDKIIITEPAEIKDLDSIKFPDRTRLNHEKYVFPLFNKKFTTLIGSRGCPYKCIYCGLPYNLKYKTRSVDNIIEELKIIQSQGYEYVSFSDDIFTLNKKRVIEICQKLKDNNIKLKWGCATRVDCVDEEILKLIKEAGCLDVRFGVESGNERIRKEVINKNISNEQYVKVINLSKKAGLITIGFFLFGQPTETLENMKETVAFAKKLKLDYASFGITVPIPNSEIFTQAMKEGKIESTIWREVIYGKSQIPFYVPDNVSIEDMKELMSSSNRAFYLRPTYILNKLKSIRSLSDLVFMVKNGINFLKNRG